jgi:hypothetical protein
MSDDIIDADAIENPQLPTRSFGEALTRLSDFDEKLAMDAVGKRERVLDYIKHAALRMTRAQDWQDMGGRPFLMSYGVEKLCQFYGISFERPTIERVDEQDGSTRFIVSGTCRSAMLNQSFYAVGERSTAEPFFADNDKRHPAKLIADVKAAARSTWERDGVARMLGLRNLSWADIEEMTGFKEADCGRVAFKRKAGAEAPAKTVAKTSPAKPSASTDRNVSRELDDKKNDMRGWLLEMAGNDVDGAREILKELSHDPNGQYKPLESVDKMSEKQVHRFHKIIKERYEEWTATAPEGSGAVDGDLPF